MKNMGIQERFNEFITYKKLSRRKFQSSIGVSNSYIRNIVNNVGEDVLNRISDVYPDLNKNWLLTGDGEMLNPTYSNNRVTMNGNENVSNIGGQHISISLPKMELKNY